MMLPALALPSRLAATAFLGMFLVGTVVWCPWGATPCSSARARRRSRTGIPRIAEKLTWAASLVAISMGLAILVSHSFGITLY
ncbi:unnamed protein product [Urochloa humidicola]